MSAALPKVVLAESPACAHCGTLLADPLERFCCPACELAAQIIHGAGLDRYYEARTNAAPRPEPTATDWSKLEVTVEADGVAHADLRLDGFRCTACAWVSEQVILVQPGVKEAHVGFSSGRLGLAFDPTATDLPRILAPVISLGYRPASLKEPSRYDGDLLLRFGVAAFAAMNVMMLSLATYLGWLGGMAERFEALFHWTNLALATPVAIWAALPFHRGAFASLRYRTLSMDLPVSLAIGVMFVHALGAALTGGEPYLDSLTMLVALLLGGRLLEARGRTDATLAASSLAGRLPGVVRRLLPDGNVEAVSPDLLVPGDTVVVASGEEIGGEGVVIEGEGSVDMALVTGESEPRPVVEGDAVLAGTVLVDGAIVIRVAVPKGARVLDRMQALLEKAVAEPVRAELTDALAPYFTGGTLLVAFVGGLLWAMIDGSARGVGVAVAVLVVACPCALSLAAPLARAAGLGALARRGLLLSSGRALDDLAEVDTVVLDKTGTLSFGALRVENADDSVLRVAAGLERYSNHPIARAIVLEARARGIPLPRATAVVERPGIGVTGSVAGMRSTIRSAGPRTVEVVGEKDVVGTIELADLLRDDAVRAVAALRALGLRTVVLSGDREEVVRAFAASAGIEEVQAGCLPEEKVAHLRRLQAEGRKILFVGDGLNDGPALHAADVGIAMGSGAASAILAADGVVLGEALHPLVEGIRLARLTRRVLERNVARSVTYNVLAVLGALAGFVNPLVAALLMPLSSGSVLFSTRAIARDP